MHEPTERQTNDFPLISVLGPASATAGLVAGQQLSAGYAAFSDGVTSDLRVHVVSDATTTIFIADGKRGLVWAELHEAALLCLLARGTVPVVASTGKPPPEVRLCYQINTRMHKYNIFYAKLFSESMWCHLHLPRRWIPLFFCNFPKSTMSTIGFRHGSQQHGPYTLFQPGSVAGACSSS